MNQQSDNNIWSWVTKEVWIVGVAIACTLFFYNQVSDIKLNQALQLQKLDMLIAWTKDHDQQTARVNGELNDTFSDIYQKLGSKYIAKLNQ